MRWPNTWVCAVSLAVMGCPEMHKPGGIIDRAAHKDALESIPERCDREQLKEFCEGNRRHSAVCREKCGVVE